MCGRFTLSTPPTEIAHHFGLAEEPKLEARFNVAPGQAIATVSDSGGGRRPVLSLRRWGLVPSWSKDTKIGNRLINARAETAAEKPSFLSALRRRRCLVPADGFYEWAGEKGSKQPYCIGLEGRALFAFAGLWERWTDPQGEPLESCTLLTTAAAEQLRALHHRMPVIVDPADYALWMDPGVEEPDLVSSVIDRNLGGALEFYPISKYVNDVRHDDPRCLEASAKQPGFF
ncbi:MAG: SOS response-associated peptidase [Deltaproteobacteria bacterium]|nr:SOS response-associated peptidase [Deltaproteobacteria bacterium]